MKLENNVNGCLTLSCSMDELEVVSNALNEICNGFNVQEFETRVGATIAEVHTLLKQVQTILDSL
jgi:hypothetical protein